MNNRYWGVIGAYIFTQFSIVLALPILLQITSFSEENIIIYWTIFSFIFGVFLTIAIMRPLMTFADNKGLQLGMVLKWTVLGILMAYGSLVVAGVIQQLVFGIEDGSQNTEDIMTVAKAYPLFVIVPILSAPILEEILFRKILFTLLDERFGFMIAAILSATAFSLIHQDYTHFLVYFAMGFVFAYLYARTQRILVPILVHMALNGITVLVLFFELAPV